MSNVEVSHSMYWDQFAGGSEPRKSDKGFKTPMAWYKPRELMLKAFVPNVAEVLSLRSALECKGISSVILNRYVGRLCVFVFFVFCFGPVLLEFIYFRFSGFGSILGALFILISEPMK